MSDPIRSTELPPPAPGFLGLVGVHLSLIHREALVGTGILLLLVLGFPLMAFLTPIPTGTESGVLPPVERLALGMMLLAGLTFVLTYFWPEVVWTRLRPGDRTPMDAWPVSRRANRLARVVAGAALPLFLLASFVAGARIIQWRGLAEHMPISTTLGSGHSGWGLLLTILVLLTSYSLASALALRFGKVILSLFTILVGVWVLVMLLVLFRAQALLESMARWMATSQFSPTRALLGLSSSSNGMEMGPTAPGVLVWFAGLSLVLFYLAHRHDRA